MHVRCVMKTFFLTSARSAAIVALMSSVVAFAPGCGSPEQEATASDSSDLRALTPAEILGTIAYGETKAGINYKSPPNYRALSFTAAAGDVVDAWVKSDDGDALAFLADAKWKTFATSDDAADDDTNSHLQATIPAAGKYYVVFRERDFEPATFSVSLTGPAPAGGGGSVVDAQDPCDDALPIAPNDAFEAARALGLCKKATPGGKDWGVLEAKFVLPDGSALPASGAIGVGVLTKLGSNVPQHGSSMLALSSGTARAPGDAGFKEPSGADKGLDHSPPTGWPKAAPATCGAGGAPSTVAKDGAALEVRVRVPSDAHSVSYRQSFFTYEFPTYACSNFADTFVALMSPPPAGAIDGNIAFDGAGTPLSVNTTFIRACKPGVVSGQNFDCPLGDAPLAGTGFADHGATGWLTTTAPVEPGTETTFRFAIWDVADGILDSTVLIDAFRFSTGPAAGVSTQPTAP